MKIINICQYCCLSATLIDYFVTVCQYSIVKSIDCANRRGAYVVGNGNPIDFKTRELGEFPKKRF